MHGLGEAVGDREDGGEAAGPVTQDHELIGADPGDCVTRPGDGPKAIGHRDQHHVAGVVAQAVVDHLEAVDVDEEHRDLVVVAMGPVETGLEAIEQQGAVGETGQVVVEGPMGELGGGAVALEGDGDERAGHVGRPGGVLRRAAGTVVEGDHRTNGVRRARAEDRCPPERAQPVASELGPEGTGAQGGRGIGHDDGHAVLATQRRLQLRADLDVAERGAQPGPRAPVDAGPGSEPVALDQQHRSL